MAGSPQATRVVIGMILVATAFLSACTSPPESIAPANLEIVCEGEGTPTVILIPGLATAADVFDSLQTQIANDTRVCSYSRAGVGDSRRWPEDIPDPSAGTAADQLRATLEANDVLGPYVVLGWSYGGLVTQAFAARHRDVVAGLVFEDSSMMGQFESDFFDPSTFAEGGRSIDLDATAEEIEDLSLTGIPVIVLTQGDPGRADAADARVVHAAARRPVGLSDDFAARHRRGCRARDSLGLGGTCREGGRHRRRRRCVPARRWPSATTRSGSPTAASAAFAEARGQ